MAPVAGRGPRQLPDKVTLAVFGSSAVTAGLLLPVLAAAAHWFGDKCTAIGYEIRMTGLPSHLSAYAGVERTELTPRLLAAPGALGGLVGTIGVLSFPYRFLDGALTAPGRTWTGPAAALLFGFDEAADRRLRGLGLPRRAADAAPFVVTLGVLFLSTARRRRRNRPAGAAS